MKKIENIMLERIIELAVESGYKPLPGNTMHEMLTNNTMEVLLVRFAHRIAKELES